VSLSEWKSCTRCGFVHQNPRPSTEALSEFYAKGRYHLTDIPNDVSDYLKFVNWYYTEKVDFALAKSGLSTGRVFEIGCGLGGALRLFSERGCASLGVEPDPTQARFASQVLKLDGVRQGLVDDSFQLDVTVDLVFSNHAFEHLADLDSVMRAVTRIVKPGGHIFTAVPTYFSNRSRLSKLWMNSGHYSLFTHQSLNQLFARYGIEEVCHTYRGWYKEIDDLWHVARFRGPAANPTVFFENPRAVQRYVNVYNPVRSIVYAPIYAQYAQRVAFMNRHIGLWNLLRHSPSVFLSKVMKRCLRALQGLSK
jgi:SAM-dependent methyltransferase